MEEEIKLTKADDQVENKLPKNIKMIVLGDKVLFVRRLLGRFVPLPEKEQEELRKKHILP